jgi:ABC-type multidrug transport system ATPase subunit
MLSVEGLRKAYGHLTALDGVDLKIQPGEICGLLGPNGAGKTTLVSIIAGLRRADAGRVVVAGVDALAHPYEARRFLGLAPQELGIYPIVTVRENLSFFGELADLRGAQLTGRVGEVAEALDLTELLDRPARDISGGEKRRVHTAMAMLHRPPLLLLDEPTTGVDVRTRARLLDAVRSLAAQDGTAICYSTHYLPEVDALDASVAIIEHGCIIARGSVAELIKQHGGSAIELVFDGPPLAIALPGRRVETVESTVRIYTDQPAADVAAVLQALGPATARLRAVEIVAPSLESVFLALTGRRYSGDQETPEQVDVLAS